jgi:hypothetical protein
MDKTFLFSGADDHVVRPPKVCNQNYLEHLFEKTFHDWTATTLVNHLIGRVLIRETPHPTCFTIDTPACFVGVKNT